MTGQLRLDDHLQRYSETAPHALAVAAAVDAIAAAAIEIADLIATGDLADACEEFAINVSNRRHWDPPVRAFIDECLAGVDGAANHNFNMRWIGSLVADAYRILT